MRIHGHHGAHGAHVKSMGPWISHDFRMIFTLFSYDLILVSLFGQSPRNGIPNASLILSSWGDEQQALSLARDSILWALCHA